MAMRRLYKYRSLHNYEWLIDLVINERLHCANFWELNDPMEGVFLYEDGLLSESALNTLKSEKRQYKVCALSEESEIFLLWSHYADSHKGLVIGADIDDEQYEISPIRYCTEAEFRKTISDSNMLSTRDILTRKLDIWEYEKEVRVFINPPTRRHAQYVKFKLREIIFGKRMDGKHKTRLKKIVNQFYKGVTFRDSEIQNRLLGLHQ